MAAQCPWQSRCPRLKRTSNPQWMVATSYLRLAIGKTESHLAVKHRIQITSVAQLKIWKLTILETDDLESEHLEIKDLESEDLEIDDLRLEILQLIPKLTILEL